MSETAAPATPPATEPTSRECGAIVVGASAGGVEALSTLVGLLPDSLQVPMFVVLHLSPAAPSVLPRILERAGPLAARIPESGQAAKAGCIYVAPPDLHMAVLSGKAHPAIELGATNRRGRAIDVAVSCTPLYGRTSEPRGGPS